MSNEKCSNVKAIDNSADKKIKIKITKRKQKTTQFITTF